MTKTSTVEEFNFHKFSDFPLELQGNIWQHTAWSATKPEQARLSLVSKTAKHWTQEVLYYTIFAEGALVTYLSTILQHDVPPARLFREKTRSLWLVSWQQPGEALHILQHLKGITRLYIQLGSADVSETLRTIANLPKLKELRLPPHYCYLVPVSPMEPCQASRSITHLIIPTDIAVDAPYEQFWTLFPNLTHLAILMAGAPQDDDFEVLCNNSPKNLIILDRAHPHIPSFTLTKRFSRKPIVLRPQNRELEVRVLWENMRDIWSAVDRGVEEAIARKHEGYFIEVKEWSAEWIKP
ncbi:hypothetical protein DL96DRAFT_1711535 [Flagelloscypha sp. PMI_526]|nr:hypothetical protein DL96DRAFT_1711535 [Flagelloscypha sp. PMI_526]